MILISHKSSNCSMKQLIVWNNSNDSRLRATGYGGRRTTGTLGERAFDAAGSADYLGETYSERVGKCRCDFPRKKLGDQKSDARAMDNFLWRVKIQSNADEFQ